MHAENQEHMCILCHALAHEQESLLLHVDTKNVSRVSCIRKDLSVVIREQHDNYSATEIKKIVSERKVLTR